MDKILIILAWSLLLLVLANWDPVEVDGDTKPKMHCILMNANISQDVYKCETGNKTCILVDGYTPGISCF